MLFVWEVLWNFSWNCLETCFVYLIIFIKKVVCLIDYFPQKTLTTHNRPDGRAWLCGDRSTRPESWHFAAAAGNDTHHHHFTSSRRTCDHSLSSRYKLTPHHALVISPKRVKVCSQHVNWTGLQHGSVHSTRTDWAPTVLLSLQPIKLWRPTRHVTSELIV